MRNIKFTKLNIFLLIVSLFTLASCGYKVDWFNIGESRVFIYDQGDETERQYEIFFLNKNKNIVSLEIHNNVDEYKYFGIIYTDLVKSIKSNGEKIEVYETHFFFGAKPYFPLDLVDNKINIEVELDLEEVSSIAFETTLTLDTYNEIEKHDVVYMSAQ